MGQEPEGPKPLCHIHDEHEGEGAMGIHVGGLCCAFPVASKRFKSLRIPPKIFFATRNFGTGVLIATCFVHLMPDAWGNLLNPCLSDIWTDKYRPLPGVIMMTSMFLLFIIELYLNAKTGGHSHGGPTGEAAQGRSPLVGHHHHENPQVLQAVTTQAWLRSKTNIDGYLEAMSKLIVYMVAAFSGNLTQAGALVLMALLLMSAGLLGLSNAHIRGLQMHGRVARPERERAKAAAAVDATSIDLEDGRRDDGLPVEDVRRR
ncbi:hypothetical protein NLG97_g3991 [Lecanicillium saksenae]|uniref:Uncharacterized protein n=1 Tax=Lecanicillium saksenae TaxID=468837 RepID=A0ACC1QWM3_9HYPO|nr:hypothetical protein NLG97_g3991 [Lecanicillium saksenae]